LSCYPSPLFCDGSFQDRVSGTIYPRLNANHNPPVNGKMVLKITSVLPYRRRRIEARCKDSVKVTVKFITKHYTFKRLKAGFL
jgi:hypothetical protein